MIFAWRDAGVKVFLFFKDPKLRREPPPFQFDTRPAGSCVIHARKAHNELNYSVRYVQCGRHELLDEF